MDEYTYLSAIEPVLVIRGYSFLIKRGSQRIAIMDKKDADSNGARHIDI